MSAKVGLVCSSGGHLAQLHAIDSFWRHRDRFWVTFDKPDARARLVGERVYWAWHPTNRHVPNLLRNAVLARKVLCWERPDVLVSDGAGVAVPFFAVARSLGIRLVFIEVEDRVDRPSLTGRLVHRWVDHVVCQVEAQRAFYPNSTVFGPIL